MTQRRRRFFHAACAAAILLLCHSVQVFAQPAAAPAWGEVRVAEQAVSVRHKPDPAAPIVRTLKPGDRVRVDFVQQSGWAALFDLTEPTRDLNRAMGYVELRQLVPAAASRPAPVPAPGQSATAPELKGAVKESPSLLSGQGPGLNKQDPVRITSEKMVYNQAENSVVFLGNVHGAQNDMAIWAAKLTAFFVDKNKKGSKDAQSASGPGGGDMGDKIERIVAEGNVRMVSGKNEGACSTLTYFPAEGVLRMEGNPILREGQNTVRGDIIKFYVRENRSEVLSGAQRRVEAIFYSQPNQGAK